LRWAARFPTRRDGKKRSPGEAQEQIFPSSVEGHAILAGFLHHGANLLVWKTSIFIWISGSRGQLVL
jgi:hypothetical protein